MIVYCQSSGTLWTVAGSTVRIGSAYSGVGAGLNNPTMQNVAGIGPLPAGLYTIEPPADDAETGPFSMRLTPDAGNEMFGRSAFLIHGDNSSLNHTASHGCIVAARAIRETVWSDPDHRLTVCH